MAIFALIIWKPCCPTMNMINFFVTVMPSYWLRLQPGWIHSVYVLCSSIDSVPAWSTHHGGTFTGWDFLGLKLETKDQAEWFNIRRLSMPSWIHGRKELWHSINYDPHAISFQPLQLISRCWSFLPHTRPTFELIRKSLHRINPNRESPVDMMMIMVWLVWDDDMYTVHIII